MRNLRKLFILLGVGLFILITTTVNAQVTNSIADQAYAGFNNAFIHQANGLTFYKTSLNDTEKDYFWQQALDIQTAQDNYFRTNVPANKTLISDLLNAFLQQNKSDPTIVQSWEWNEYNDDLFWAALAFCRGYEYTNDNVFLEQAQYAFNLAYFHNSNGFWGWDNQLGGGIWWSKSMEHKETLSNGPGIVTACYLYQFTGEQFYLDKAIEIYNWLRATLYNPTNGAVYSKIAANGDIDYTENVFNSGSFGGAANFLYQITGDINYFNDAKKAFDFTKNIKYNNDFLYATNRGGSENAEYIRWLGEFVRQNNLWNEYYPWMKLNADRAWSMRRTDLNITWNDWRNQTPTDNSNTTNESNSAVVIQEVTPIVQTIPGTIQAEDYNFMKGVITETTTDTGGGLHVGLLNTGNYVEYIINVPTSGLYDVKYRVASNSAGSVTLLHQGQILTTTALPNTGGGQIWQDVSAKVNLVKGYQSMRLLATVGGWNINKLDITKNTGCDSNIITAYQNVNNEGVQQASTSILDLGQSITFAPQSVGGTWSWKGPNGYSATTREITISNIQTNQGGIYTATNTNSCGANSTQDFNVTVNPCPSTAIIPYINVNGTGWTSTFETSTTPGSNIEIGPQPFGTWRWTGPNGFTSNSRQININNIQSNQFGIYVATFTNDCGAKRAQNFVITNTLSVSSLIASKKEDSFIMYPNPNEGELNIMINGELHNSLNIFTTTGVLVYSKQLKNEANLKINVSDVLKTGVYFVSLKSNSDTSTKVLIVE